jgi:hypothetical protein
MRSTTERKRKTDQAGFRPDRDVANGMEKWLMQNPAWDKTALLNQAVREFITHPHVTKPVEIEVLAKDESDELINKIIRKRAKTLERLK